MFLFLILPILVSGFIVCNHNLRYYFRLHRYEGQYLYLKCAHFGLIQLFIAAISGFFLSSQLPSNLNIGDGSIGLELISGLDAVLGPVLSAKLQPEVHTLSWTITLSVWTILVAYITSMLDNLRLSLKLGSTDKAKILLMGEVLRDSPIDRLFYQSYITSRPLLVTLESGKVYVGTISELGEPNEAEGMDQEISLIPLLSGYRTKTQHRVEFVTDYQQVDPDLNIVIRQDKIITASWFNFEIYKKLNPPTTAKSSELQTAESQSAGPATQVSNAQVSKTQSSKITKSNAVDWGALGILSRLRGWLRSIIGQ